MEIKIGNYSLEEYKRYLPKSSQGCIARIKAWMYRRQQNISALFNRIFRRDSQPFVTSNQLENNFIDWYPQALLSQEHSLTRITKLFNQRICPNRPEIKAQFTEWQNQQEKELRYGCLLLHGIPLRFIRKLHDHTPAAQAWLTMRTSFFYVFDVDLRKVQEKPPFLSEHTWDRIEALRSRYPDLSFCYLDLQWILNNPHLLLVFGEDAELAKTAEAKLFCGQPWLHAAFLNFKEGIESELKERSFQILPTLSLRLTEIISTQREEESKEAYMALEREVKRAHEQNEADLALFTLGLIPYNTRSEILSFLHQGIDLPESRLWLAMHAIYLYTCWPHKELPKRPACFTPHLWEEIIRLHCTYPSRVLSGLKYYMRGPYCHYYLREDERAAHMIERIAFPYREAFVALKQAGHLSLSEGTLLSHLMPFISERVTQLIESRKPIQRIA